jgi:hypothetical protein
MKYAPARYVIPPKMKTIEHHNPISGHRWTEDTILKGYEVSGGRFTTTSHSTLKSAQKEVALRTSLGLKIEKLDRGEAL